MSSSPLPGNSGRFLPSILRKQSLSRVHKSNNSSGNGVGNALVNQSCNGELKGWDVEDYIENHRIQSGEIRKTPSAQEQRVFPAHHSSSQIMVLSGEPDKKPINRKEVARRQLVGGLSANGFGSNGVRRSQSFQLHPFTRESETFHYRPSLDSSWAYSRASDSSFTKKSSLTHQNSMSRVSFTEKTREAIDNWNHLMHELYLSERINDHDLSEEQKHLAVLSDRLSEVSDKTPVENKIKPAKQTKNVFIRSNKKDPTALLPLTHVQFPVGLGYTRYRPITPNLLQHLDKQKLPTKKRTQLWINQLQESRRASLSLSRTEETQIATNEEYQVISNEGSKSRSLLTGDAENFQKQSLHFI